MPDGNRAALAHGVVTRMIFPWVATTEPLNPGLTPPLDPQAPLTRRRHPHDTPLRGQPGPRSAPGVGFRPTAPSPAGWNGVAGGFEDALGWVGWRFGVALPAFSARRRGLGSRGRSPSRSQERCPSDVLPAMALPLSLGARLRNSSQPDHPMLSFTFHASRFAAPDHVRKVSKHVPG